MEQLAIPQRNDLVTDTGFEIVKVDNDGVERRAQTAVDAEIPAAYEIRVTPKRKETLRTAIHVFVAASEH